MSADIIFIEGSIMCVLRCINWNFELKFMATLVGIIRLSVLNKIIGQGWLLGFSIYDKETITAHLRHCA